MKIQCACVAHDEYECAGLRWGKSALELAEMDEGCVCDCHTDRDEHPYPEDLMCSCLACSCDKQVDFAGDRCGMCREACFDDGGSI